MTMDTALSWSIRRSCFLDSPSGGSGRRTAPAAGTCPDERDRRGRGGTGDRSGQGDEAGRRTGPENGEAGSVCDGTGPHPCTRVDQRGDHGNALPSPFRLPIPASGRGRMPLPVISCL
ncbi:hypothetical protein GCM10010106_19700 [Thermopolyspora flexuosa]|nr:hypothetical protein GCM10010106_19700 [Thermopolyspora flexuosa]